ncbi:unnamed protein product [Closterium sp. NIES-53]
MDAEMASWKSTCTYIDAFPLSRGNIVDGMRIFRVKRLPGSLPVFKARYVARGFSQRQGVHFFHTFSPTPKMTTLRLLLHVAAQRDYELHSLDFSTPFLQGSLHEEIWLHGPPGFIGSFPAGTQWSLRRPVYDLRQPPRKRHDTLWTTLAALGFAPLTAHPSLYFSALASGTPRHSPLLCLRVTRSQLHLWTSSAHTEIRTRDLRSDNITSGMGLVLGGQGLVFLTRHADGSWVDDVATQRSSQGYTFSLHSGSVSLRSTGSSSVS